MPARNGAGNRLRWGNDMTQAIVEAARVQPGVQVLDIACGTGEPAITVFSHDDWHGAAHAAKRRNAGVREKSVCPGG